MSMSSKSARDGKVSSDESMSNPERFSKTMRTICSALKNTEQCEDTAKKSAHVGRTSQSSKSSLIRCLKIASVLLFTSYGEFDSQLRHRSRAMFCCCSLTGVNRGSRWENKKTSGKSDLAFSSENKIAGCALARLWIRSRDVLKSSVDTVSSRRACAKCKVKLDIRLASRLWKQGCEMK